MTVHTGPYWQGHSNPMLAWHIVWDWAAGEAIHLVHAPCLHCVGTRPEQLPSLRYHTCKVLAGQELLEVLDTTAGQQDLSFQLVCASLAQSTICPATLADAVFVSQHKIMQRVHSSQQCACVHDNVQGSNWQEQPWCMWFNAGYLIKMKSDVPSFRPVRMRECSLALKAQQQQSGAKAVCYIVCINPARLSSFVTFAYRQQCFHNRR